MGFLPREVLLEMSPARRTAVRWEEPACALCGNRRARTILAAQDLRAGTGLWFAVAECTDCGLCYTNPRPAAESRPRFQKLIRSPRPRHRFPRFRMQRSRPPLPWRGEGRLLDIGGYNPTFLQRMRSAGWHVHVLADGQADAVAGAPSAHGAAPTGTLLRDDLAEHSFDAVTFLQSLEEQTDPVLALRKVRRWMAPGGVLVIEAPNLDSLAFRLFGECWHGLDLPRHLTHFTPWTLNLLLEQAGFRMQRVHMRRGSGGIRRSARSAVKAGPRGWLRRWLQTRLGAGLAGSFAWLTGQGDMMLATATC